MKTWLKTLIAIMLMLTCMFAYAACDVPSQNEEQVPSDDSNPTPDNENENNGVIQPEIPEKSYRVKFVYSYTAQMKNKNDRTQNVKDTVTVHTVYVDYENNGWTDALKAEKDAISYNGYKFDCWYAQWDDSVKPQAPVGDPYTFDGEINSDIVLYAYRGDKVGDNIVWDIEYFYETSDAVLSEEVSEGSVEVDFVYRTTNGNVTENITLAATTVSTSADATALDTLKAEANAITYNGCSFTAWYAEGSADPYDFATAPTEKLVLYGEIFDPTVLPEVPAEIPNGSFKADFVYEADSGQVDIATLVVSGTEGWTDVQKAMVAALSYDNHSFTGWKTYVGETEAAYDFTAAPTADIVLYGAGLSETEIVPVVTEKDERSAILTLTGHGRMYDSAQADEVDVPWYSHRKSITAVKIVPTDAENGITYIGKNAFAGCTKLTSVDWGEKLEEIGANAFEGANAKAFKYLRLPSTVKTIGEYAFSQTSLQHIYFEQGTAKVEQEDGTTTEVPTGIETIGQYAFYKSTSIKSVVVPTTLKTVGGNAFNPDSSVSSSYLSKVYYMGNDISPITGVDANGNALPENAKKINISINNDWFCSTKLTTIYTYMSEADSAPHDAEYLRTWWHWTNDEANSFAVQYSFALKYQYNNLTIATDYVEAKVQEDEAGNVVLDSDGNPKLAAPITEANITFRYNLYYNGYRFHHYGDDKNFGEGYTITDDTPVSCERSTSATEGKEGYLGGGIKWETSNAKDGGKILTIKPWDGVTTDDSGKILKHESETANHTWDFANPADATSLWDGNSLHGSQIKTVVIEDGVERIGKFLFAGLVSITEVVIPESVTEIDPTAFDDCASLLSIYYMKDGVDIVDVKGAESSLTAKNAVAFVKVEAGTEEDGAYWMQMGDKKVAWKLTTETVEENGTVKTTGRNLYVGGDVEMVDFAVDYAAPWFAAKETVTSLTVANNIQKLGANMVLNYKNITNISLPEHLKVIPATALAGTGIVNNVADYTDGMLVINRHLIKVNPAIFTNSNNSNNISTNFFATTANIFTIAGGAFARCETITDLFISNTVQYINADAFDDPSKVANIFVNLKSDSATGVPAAWPAIVNDIKFNNAKVYYSGEYSPVTLEGNVHVTVGYKGNEGICHHIYGDFVENNDATCISNATKTRECIFCKELPEDKRVEGWQDTVEIENTMNSHNFENYTYNDDATCISYGTETGTCTTCPEGTTPAIDKRDRVEGEGVAYGLHTFETYVYNNDATCEHAATPSYGTETATCTVCKTETQTRDREEGEGVAYAACVFDQEIVDDKYLKAEATTESAAIYWKSCKCCGTASTNEEDVFSYGDPLTSDESQSTTTE